jgi:anti-sigma regulatory factor (Ser/Thr protein kinase)
VVGFVHDALAGRLISVESFATVLYARLSLAEQQIEYVGCGHPPAIRYSGSSRSCSLLSGEDPPIGFVHHNDYSSFRVPIDPGDVLVLYSDGITEAFNPEGEMLGQDRLIEAVRAAAELPASQIVQEVARLISDFTAAALDPKDDLTLVVVRMRHGEVRFEGEVQELVIPRRSPRLHEMRAFVGGIVGEAYPGAREGYAGEVVRAVQEAVTNAMRHPRPQDPESPVMVRVETAREELVVEVRYDGHPFQPETVELPDVSQFPQGGFGLYIIEQSMDNVSYGRAADGRNFIRLVKRAP